MLLNLERRRIIFESDEMDAKENESLFLCDICCSIGISSTQRIRNIQFIDCSTTMANMYYSNEFIYKIITCGSWSEGINPFPMTLNIGLQSDIDIMFMLNCINVQEHVDTTNTNHAEVLQMLYTGSAEHVLLEVKSYERAYKTFNNTSLSWMLKVIEGKHSKYFVSSSLLKEFIQEGLNGILSPGPSIQVSNDLRKHYVQTRENINTMTIHGPAVMSGNRPVSGLGSTDMVCCLRCYEWPSAAHEWIDRARPNGWPSQDLIDQIKNDGCELVPVGSKDHLDEDVQWKLSFSRAETRLIRNFNIYQAQCYQLLKIVKHHCISSVVADSLSSYHIKTVMLHTVEHTDPKVWKKDNLAQCFMMCLSNLKRYLTDKFLPQYFIVRQNLLEPKVTGDIHQQVLEIVTDLDKKGWKCILQCPPFNLMWWFIQYRNSYKRITDVLSLEGNNDIIVDFCKKLFKYVLSQVEESLSYNCYLIRSVGLCETTFLKPATAHPSVETARMIQSVIKGTLGVLLTVIRAMTHPDLRAGIDPLMNFARQCLEDSCKADVSSCRLKLATFFFQLGEYDRCIAAVQDVLQRFKDVWVVVGGMDTNVDERKERLRNMDTSKLQFKLNRVLQLFDNGFPFISNHLSFPAFFTHWEVAVAPKGVQFVHTTTRSHNVLINKVCFIDSIVYAHYLLVESYLKIDKYDDAEHALINMKQSIQNGKNDMFDRNCLCFCEEDTLLLHHSESLMQATNNV